MNKSDVFYGMKDWERLEHDLDEALRRAVDETCDTAGDVFAVIASRIEWPIRILVYRRMALTDKHAERIARDALEDAMENLDEEYADADGDPTTPTEDMKAAALAFGRAVVAEYVPWNCAPTGEVIEYTREQVEKDQVTP